MTANATPTSMLDSERTDLLAELATARSALTNTARGLTDEQIGEHPTVSALCLGGLIKHRARRRCASTCPLSRGGARRRGPRWLRAGGSFPPARNHGR